ncbi:MAG: DUF4302 domain-containing protein [Bacteroides sp.]|nr:DUF4302 domain-containing protein [Bacteroides sp.]
MKLYKVLSVALIALSSTLFQACLKDQNDIFDESPSERMQMALDNARKVLTSSPEGWVFEYFPDKKLSYGGYVYTLQFDDEKVNVGSEIAPGEFVSSYYKFTNDNGPMLTFDTYNSLMHYFATPSSGKYQGMDGDFEFMIMNVSNDVVELRGKRTGNTMYLRRLDVPAEEYLDGVNKMIDNLILTSAEGTVGGDNVVVDIDANKRYMEFSWGGESRSDDEPIAGGYYLPTPTGITFPEPVNVNGTTVASLAFDASTLTYSSEGVSFGGEVAPEFAFFNEFEGEFDFIYSNGKKTIPVTLVRDVQNKKIYIKGLNELYDWVATYDASKGRIEINSQIVYEKFDGENNIWICGWGSPVSTSVNRSLTVGMYVVKDPENPGTYLFTPNDDTTLEVHSFIVYRCGPTGSMLGNASAYPDFHVNGSHQIASVVSLVKK